LTISSRQSSGGNDPGPKDFKVQYSTDDGTSWIDIEDGEITVENDWETGVLENIPLPENCFDRSQLMIRWLMASNEASGAGGDVLETGKSKIDEIYVRGEQINVTCEISSLLKIEIYPNPASDILNIRSEENIDKLIFSDLSGRKILDQQVNAKSLKLDISRCKKGCYLLTIRNEGSSQFFTQKLMVD
jgi:hypothetical protein